MTREKMITARRVATDDIKMILIERQETISSEDIKNDGLYVWEPMGWKVYNEKRHDKKDIHTIREMAEVLWLRFIQGD